MLPHCGIPLVPFFWGTTRWDWEMEPDGFLCRSVFVYSYVSLFESPVSHVIFNTNNLVAVNFIIGCLCTEMSQNV